MMYSEWGELGREVLFCVNLTVKVYKGCEGGLLLNEKEEIINK